MAKMTKWFKPGVVPVHKGEYNASLFKDPYIRRWWNGKQWSEPYLAISTEAHKRKKRRMANAGGNVFWRGLVEQPEDTK